MVERSRALETLRLAHNPSASARKIVLHLLESAACNRDHANEASGWAIVEASA